MGSDGYTPLCPTNKGNRNVPYDSHHHRRSKPTSSGIGGGQPFRLPPLTDNIEGLQDGEVIVTLCALHYRAGEVSALVTIHPKAHDLMGLLGTMEAWYSAQIEGIHVSLETLFLALGSEKDSGTEDVRRLLTAENDLVETPGPVSMATLLSTYRTVTGKTDGLRKTQNWIGRRGCGIGQARFVPPGPECVIDHLNDLLRFHLESRLNPYIKMALCHYQLETLHPFVDGNGRVGRVLIQKDLTDAGAPLGVPVSKLLFLGRQDYYDELMRARESQDLAQWVVYFLKILDAALMDTVKTLKDGIEFSRNHRSMVAERFKGVRLTRNRAIFEAFEKCPVATVGGLATRLASTYPTVMKGLNDLMELGLVGEVTGQQRERVFVYLGLLDLLKKPRVSDVMRGGAQTTTF